MSGLSPKRRVIIRQRNLARRRLPTMCRTCAGFYYRAMHFSAKRGIAIACRLSVCLSVCNVGEL